MTHRQPVEVRHALSHVYVIWLWHCSRIKPTLEQLLDPRVNTTKLKRSLRVVWIL